MGGYKGSRISIPEMLDDLMQAGHSAVDAGLQIRRAFEDEALIFANNSGRKRTKSELIADIQKLASAWGARLSGEHVSSGEGGWQMHLREVWTSRELYEEVFGGKRSTTDLSANRALPRVKCTAKKYKQHWDAVCLQSGTWPSDSEDEQWAKRENLSTTSVRKCRADFIKKLPANQRSIVQRGGPRRRLPKAIRT